MKIVTFFKILSVLVLLCGTCLLNASGEDTGKAPVENPNKCEARLTIDGLGVICGETVTVSLDPDPVQIRAYTRIPYAKPPVKELRWQKPQPQEKWSGELDATQCCPQCPQPCNNTPNPIQEDCLYLNVWTPANITTQRHVMVFIHGGAFMEGSGGGPLFDGSYMAAYGDVVVVTINYRLGILGFLVYPEEGLHGNFGLLDQECALQWVYDHIESFGGDKHNITIFGESAGAASIGFHLMKANPVFKAAIMESNPYALPYLTEAEAAILGKKLVGNIRKVVGNKNLSVSDMRKMGWCELKPLLDKAAKGISSFAIDEWGLKGLMTWKPVIKDKTSSQPINAVPKKTLIVGTNKDEGVMFADIIKNAIEQYLVEHFHITLGKTKIGSLVYIILINMLFPDPGHAFNILLEYPPAIPVLGDNTFQFSRVLTDCLFTGGNLYYMERADGKDLYAYYYTYVSNSYQFPNLPDCKDYVCHSAELPYVFHNFDSPNGKGEADDTDKKFSDVLVGYWTNFAKNKQPGGSWENWSQYGYRKLDVEQGKVTRGRMAEKCKYSFWKPIIKDLNK
jgi:carboxylesterase type B